MEESTGRILEERERETQSARSAAEPSSAGSVREEVVEQINPKASPSRRDVDMDEGDNNEGDSFSPEESNEPSTALYVIRRRLGPLEPWFHTGQS